MVALITCTILAFLIGLMAGIAIPYHSDVPAGALRLYKDPDEPNPYIYLELGMSTSELARQKQVLLEVDLRDPSRD